MLISSRSTVSALLLTTALAVTGCGGSSSKTSSSTGSTPAPAPASTSSTATASSTGGSGGTVALDSPQAHASLVNALRNTPGVPRAQDDRLATCATQRLRAQGYTTLNSVPGPAGEKAGRACAEQLLGGINGPIAHQALVSRISRLPGVSPPQANRITDCVIARLGSEGYKSITAVPGPAATKAGHDCAVKILRR